MTVALLENPRRKTFKVGTLVYTKAGLAAVFAWFTGVQLSMMFAGSAGQWFPLFLREYDISNKEIIILTSTIGSIINMVFNPIISPISDRTRTKWGRRRPFMIFTVPVVAVIVGLMPFTPEITKAFTSVGWVASLLNMFPVAPLFLVLAVLIALQRFLDMFFGTTYYYYIPDTVPSSHIGRLYSVFRIMGMIHGPLFSWFLYPLILTHTKILVVTGAVFYCVSVLLLCWRVKEGEYPPVELKQEEKKPPWYEGVRRYVKECYGHSYYWMIYIYYGATQWGGLVGSLSIFFYRDELGLSLSTLGKFNAVMGVVTLPLGLFANYIAGIWVDRWGALKTKIYMFFYFPVNIASLFLVMGLREIALFSILMIIPGSLMGIANAKLLIDLYPRDRYGQFCSAGAIVVCVVAIIVGPLLGMFYDWLQWYRFLGLWGLFLSFASFPILLILYRRWKAYGGGTDQYSPP